MAVFEKLYDRVLLWSQHRHAPYYLSGLSFAESSFFPIPPDVMLAPMSLARPKSSWRFAFLTTLFSVLGGIAGYLIGMFAFEFIEPHLHSWGYWETYLEAKAWFAKDGVWVIFLAGFTPIPYKIFTITAGVIAMSFIPFVIASFVGRGARFFLVAGLMKWGGERMESVLRKYMDTIGIIVLVIVVILYFIFRT